MATHVNEMVELAAIVIRSGIKDGSFRGVDPATTARAVLVATSPFHHPAHSAEWTNPERGRTYNDLWDLLMDGLCVSKGPGCR